AGHELAGLVVVVIGDGEAGDVALDFLSELGDESLGGLGEELGEGEGGGSLDEGGAEEAENDGEQELGMAFSDDVVDEQLGGDGEAEAEDAVDDHEEEAEGEEAAAGLDEGPDLGPGGAELLEGAFGLLTLFVLLGSAHGGIILSTGGLRRAFRG